MFLPIIAALYWKRCSKGAAFASIIVSQGINICFPLFLVPAATKVGGSMSVMFGNTGYLPAFWSVVGGAVVLFLGIIFFPEGYIRVFFLDEDRITYDQREAVVLQVLIEFFKVGSVICHGLVHQVFLFIFGDQGYILNVTKG